MEQVNVAIADDNERILDLLEEIINMDKELHVVGKAKNGEEMCQIIRNKQPDVVLLDLIMPKMDGSGVLGGLELIHLLHKNFNPITIVTLSDFHHADAVQELSDLGYPCLLKPRRGDTKGEQFAALMIRLKEQLKLH